MKKIIKKIFNFCGLEIHKKPRMKKKISSNQIYQLKELEAMYRTKIIQTLIDETGTENYLEIGMGPGVNFLKINCKYKVCVDPNPTVPVTCKMTSDAFFEQNNTTFGVIFIDGLHWSQQVYKDIQNSLRFLEDGGYIICHDMNPKSEFSQRYPQPEVDCEWTGDSWKAWVKLRSERSDLSMFVIDIDFGCGVISKGSQELLEFEGDFNYESLEKNRNGLLNLISFEDFKKEHGKYIIKDDLKN